MGSVARDVMGDEILSLSMRILFVESCLVPALGRWGKASRELGSLVGGLGVESSLLRV